jgi:hypothetical protein
MPKNLSEEDFRRSTGLKRSTFDRMVEILLEAKTKKTRGRKSKLGLEDKLSLTLCYLREDRTFQSMALEYNIDESNAIRICHWVENILAKQEEFGLPGKKVVQRSDMEYEAFVIDATEIPVERPSIKFKKNKK